MIEQLCSDLTDEHSGAPSVSVNLTKQEHDSKDPELTCTVPRVVSEPF